VYSNETQFVQIIKDNIDFTCKHDLNFEQHSWKSRATQFERRLLECIK
jgi:hypothetical protein